MNFYEKVYEVVCMIPKGKVATYGQIAFLCGSPRASRAVGYALHNNKSPDLIPCYRVVNRFGELSKSFAFGGINAQKEKLLADNINFINDYTVDLNMYLWDNF